MTQRLTWPVASCLAIALVACQRTNPAFDPDDVGDGGSEDNGDASTTTTQSTTQSTTNMGDGDGDPDAGDGDADTMDPPDTGMEEPIADMLPEGECKVEPNPGLWPRFGKPSQFLNNTCPPGFSGHVRVWGSTGSDWMVGHCQLGCSAPCDMQTQWQVGADNLDQGPAVLYPAMNFNPLAPTIGCYYIEAAENIKQEEEGCYYASLSIHAHDGAQSPLLFNANRNGYGLTAAAVVQYGPFMPPISDQMLDTCVCEGLEFECCAGQTVIAKQFELGDPVIPPSGMGTINLNDSPFIFLGAQAQSGTNCAVEPEISWAIWADN